MSQFNMHAIMEPNIQFANDDHATWKGKTFTQVYAAIKKNKNTGSGSTHAIRKAQPLKIYRREIVTSPDAVCSEQRFATKFDDLARPNGYMITEAAQPRGLLATLDAKETVYSTQDPKKCANTTVCLTIPQNALTRVRSSGIVKPNFNYNYKQYLERRNRTFYQNQFNFNRATEYGPNVFAAQGAEMLNCPKLHVPVPFTFGYRWIGASTVTVVTVPTGSYDTVGINALLQAVMINQGHYFVNSHTGGKFFLLGITYNMSTRQVQLTSQLCNTIIFDPQTYSCPAGTVAPSSASTRAPQLVMSPAAGVMLGFAPAFVHPASQNQVYLPQQSSVLVVGSTTTPTIEPPPFVEVAYKPSNAAFAMDGAQMSSAQTSRLNHHAGMTTVSTHKEFPICTTPVFSKYSNQLRRVQKKGIY